jgi:hypothetical protein
MAKKKDNFVIIRSETLELNFYAVRSKDGKWLRAKGYGGSGKSWVDEMSKAKIYANPGPAKAQITFWAKNYPEYGVPELVQSPNKKSRNIEESSEDLKLKLHILNRKKLQVLTD